MKGAGIAAAIGGLMMALASLLMKTSVHSDGGERFGTYIPSADTLNIGLLQNQQLVFMGGCALFIAGVILFGAGSIIEALGFRRESAVEACPSHLVDQGDRPTGFSTQDAAARRSNANAFYLWSAGFIVLVLIAIFALSRMTSSSQEAATQVSNNAEMLADQLEAQADNILADERSK